MALVVATGNAGKLREIRRLLADSGIEVLGLGDFPSLPKVVEDGLTHADNARKKAATVARLTGHLTLADDSGLAVDALAGRPGIHSARFAGDDADDVANNRKLLAELAGLPAAQRRAAFHCVMALCRPDDDCRVFHGMLPGLVLEAPRGKDGFGYDPLFWVPDYERTLAELPLEVKNRISHRGQALRQVVAHLLFRHAD